MFARLDEKHNCLGILARFLNVFDENSIEKLNFYPFLRKSFSINKAFRNNIIFLQQFCSGSGGFEIKMLLFMRNSQICVRCIAFTVLE